MKDVSNPIKRLAANAVATKRMYVKAELKYIGSVMKELSQEDLVECLETLNMKELKMVIGAGVPGHALFKAHELLREKKERMEMFIENEGTSATVEVETNEEEEEEPVEEEPVQKSTKKQINN